ncbi:hypothetical protein LTR53_016350, partial [Teratosphaeriaceae sp. CCFEE 6253]
MQRVHGLQHTKQLRYFTVASHEALGTVQCRVLLLFNRLAAYSFDDLAIRSAVVVSYAKTGADAAKRLTEAAKPRIAKKRDGRGGEKRKEQSGGRGEESKVGCAAESDEEVVPSEKDRSLFSEFTTLSDASDEEGDDGKIEPWSRAYPGTFFPSLPDDFTFRDPPDRIPAMRPPTPPGTQRDSLYPTPTSTTTPKPAPTSPITPTTIITPLAPIYTTPALPPIILAIPPPLLHYLGNQGYDPVTHGPLVRLRDSPEGHAVWTGMRTFSDLSNGLRLELHPHLLGMANRAAVDVVIGGNLEEAGGVGERPEEALSPGCGTRMTPAWHPAMVSSPEQKDA